MIKALADLFSEGKRKQPPEAFEFRRLFWF
ncbi:hypothetical protein X474_11320 [Dethiosulfatarculus sandiegensis]|uniref:Uncharacterized protein n=1 Tax=Dethiosulfatarculus sandiegensis TaxID=1429043 RepID=A0A0D2JW62_9BACT|nr:hypothetical protein X474_11320 [Dethiosulfatarculus sandiegensis]